MPRTGGSAAFCVNCLAIYYFVMDAYYLPNGVRIDVEILVNLILGNVEASPQIYLDIETGIPAELASGVSGKHLLIERYTNTMRDEAAQTFINEVLANMASIYVINARSALTNGGWSSMEQFLEKDTDGWVHAWAQFISDEIWEYIDEFLTDNPNILIKKMFEGCDNCAICELMRKGEGGNQVKLMKAFETENVMQNVKQQLEEKR